MKNFHHYIFTNFQNTRSVSRKLGISEDRLIMLKEGLSEPTYVEMRKVSEVSKLPISFLLKEYSQQEDLSVLYRKQIGSLPDTIVDNFNFYVNNIIALRPPKDKIENFHDKIPPVDNTQSNAEKLAYVFREEYFNGNHTDPLSDLPQLLSNKLNLIVKVIELGKGADGASAVLNGYIFLMVSPRFEGRMLFTLAHELAHVINHHREGDYVFFDQPYDLRPRNDTKRIEGFANDFASALLLPEEGVVRVIETVREVLSLEKSPYLSDVEILYLARIYSVSFDVAGSRCESLGLLPTGGAYSLSMKLKEKHGSAEKRAEELDLPPRMKIDFPPAPNFVLQRAIDLIYNEEYSSGKIAEILGIPVQNLLKYNSRIDQ